MDESGSNTLEAGQVIDLDGEDGQMHVLSVDNDYLILQFTGTFESEPNREPVPLRSDLNQALIADLSGVERLTHGGATRIWYLCGPTRAIFCEIPQSIMPVLQEVGIDQLAPIADSLKKAKELVPTLPPAEADDRDGLMLPMDQINKTIGLPDSFPTLEAIESNAAALAVTASTNENENDSATPSLPESEAATMASGLPDADATLPIGTAAPDDLAVTSEIVEELWGESLTMDLDIGQTIRNDSKPTQSYSRLQIKSKGVADEDGEITPPPDFQIIEKIGEGGMGTVYAARQTSLDRRIALKLIKPRLAADTDHRNKFISEAAVTSDLHHPNIPPIHEIGLNPDGIPFFAMEEVTGKPWSHYLGSPAMGTTSLEDARQQDAQDEPVGCESFSFGMDTLDGIDLPEESNTPNPVVRHDHKSLNEHIDILMQVANALAYAHSRGVIHRDIKPENVMLGEFGEVYLMDWGLAAAIDKVQPGSISESSKVERISASSAAGGTPAYLAPEMASGKVELIDQRSDVYLLGAVLYEVLTGKRPHTGGSLIHCMMNAANNTIQETDQEGELIDIAMKAMATDPKDRYQSIKELQEAIREYERHSESIILSTKAEEALAQAGKSKAYSDYARSMFTYEEALALWNENKAARVGSHAARIAYANTALHNGDLELASTLLHEGKMSNNPLMEKIEAEQKERTKRRKQAVRFKRLSIAAAAIIVIGLIIGYLQVSAEQKKTEEALQVAESQRDRAELAEKDARDEAESLIAIMARLSSISRPNSESKRRRQYALKLAQKCGLNKSEQDALRLASDLMDIGRMSLVGVVGKDGDLSEKEKKLIKKEHQFSAEIVSHSEKLNKMGVPRIIRSVREHWDGSGVPDGLKGEDIPIGSRVLTISWAYMGMTSDRQYRKRLSKKRAIRALKESKGKRYDPNLVDLFIAILQEEDLN